MPHCRCEKRCHCKCEIHHDQNPINKLLDCCEKVLFTGSYNVKNNKRKEDETTILKTLNMYISINPNGYNPRLVVQYSVEDDLLPPNKLANETFNITSFSKTSNQEIGAIQFTSFYQESKLLNDKYGVFNVNSKSGIYSDVKKVFVLLKDDGEREVYFIGKD